MSVEEARVVQEAQPDGGWEQLDAAVSRLEDHLASLPYDRALPDLDGLLRGAGVDRELLLRDERARKVLHEAILARPLSTAEAVAQRATEVELLTLEVSVLTGTLRRAARGLVAADGDDEVARAIDRLTAIRVRLAELRAEL